MNKEINKVMFKAISKIRKKSEIGSDIKNEDDYIKGLRLGSAIMKTEIIDLLYDVLDEVNGERVPRNEEED